jgi:hypothetical protein
MASLEIKAKEKRIMPLRDPIVKQKRASQKISTKKIAGENQYAGIDPEFL